MPQITCSMCPAQFYAKPNRITKGQAKYCSPACSALARSKPTISLTCAHCQQPFTRKRIKLDNSKSGLYFCKRQCKDAAQRIGGLTAIMPPHYGKGDGRYDYRERALRHYGANCTKCGFTDIRAIEVHHKDKNRSNNEVANLEVLCANCHCISHSSQ